MPAHTQTLPPSQLDRDVLPSRRKAANVCWASEEAASHFGWIAQFLAIDGPACSAQTREHLGWRPVEPGLISDLDTEHYFALERAA
jgi:hypothetical protein